MEVVAYHFTTPGDGKSLCDGMASMAKMKINVALHKPGGKATTPSELANTLVGEDPMTNSLVLVGPMVNYDPDQKPAATTVKGIKSFNAFEYAGPQKVRVWKQSGIGDGKILANVKVDQSEASYRCRIVTKFGVHEPGHQGITEL